MTEHFKHCYIHEGQLCSCGAGGPVDGLADDKWDNLPPHLQSALSQALEGLSEASGDHSTSFNPAVQAMWDVMDQIEAYTLQKKSSDNRE